VGVGGHGSVALVHVLADALELNEAEAGETLACPEERRTKAQWGNARGALDSPFPT
jgi:hypothetical protein